MRARKGGPSSVPSSEGEEASDIAAPPGAKSHKRDPSRVLLRRLALLFSAIVGITIVQVRVFLQMRGSGGIALAALAEVENVVLSLRKTKPKIYIDIGPYDERMSFLQCVLSRNAYSSLKRDNMLYLGKCNLDCLPDRDDATRSVEPPEFCLPEVGEVRTPSRDVSPLLRNELNRLARSNRNAIMVWESVGGARQVEALLDVLRDKWDVHLIVHYRRLYSWLPSFFNHIQCPGWDGREEYLIWPRDGLWRPTQLAMARGRLRLPFDIFSETGLKRNSMPGRTILGNILNGSRHPVEHALSSWSTNVSIAAVHVVEMDRLQTPTQRNGGDPLLTHLFCNVIPSLHHTCNAVRRNELEIHDVGRTAPFPAESYDLLAVAAHVEGLHPLGIARLSRPDVWDMIQERQELTLGRNSSDFPLRCMPPKALNFLLELSLAAENAIFPGHEYEHRRQFQQSVQNGDYCYIDAEKTLEHPDWKDFFLPYVSVAPHVVERSSQGRSWTPEIDRFKSTEELFFSSHLGRPHKAWLPQLDLVAFLNVPGTGASVLLEYLLKSQRELSFVNHMNDSPTLLPSGVGVPVACIFGSPRMLVEPSAPAVTGASLPSCPESVAYPDLVGEWLRYLPNLAAAGRIAGPYNESIASSPRKISSRWPRRTRLLHEDLPMADETYDETSDLQVSMTLATVVRDPLDRLATLFGDWKENKRALEGHDALPRTLEHWLELIGTEAKGLVPHQYASLELNVRDAIARIHGPKANTLVLLHECWDASVRLLNARHPTAFDSTVANDLLTSRASRMIRGDANESLVDADNGAGLRKRARSWFAEDYKFYDAAVSRFVRMVTSSNLDEDDVQECVGRLKQRGHRLPRVGGKAIQ